MDEIKQFTEALDNYAKNSCTSICRNSVTDVDFKNMKVKFYYANFTKPDSWGRIYDSKSFNRTTALRNNTFPHLIEHDPANIVGKTIEMGADSKGAWAVSQLADTTKGRDTFELYKSGIYNTHSFAGYIVNSEITEYEGQEYEYVKELQLEEVTSTIFPANDNAQLISIGNSKNMLHTKQTVEELKERINSFDKELRKISSETEKKLDSILRVMNTMAKTVEAQNYEKKLDTAVKQSAQLLKEELQKGIVSQENIDKKVEEIKNSNNPPKIVTEQDEIAEILDWIKKI